MAVEFQLVGRRRTQDFGDGTADDVGRRPADGRDKAVVGVAEATVRADDAKLGRQRLDQTQHRARRHPGTGFRARRRQAGCERRKVRGHGRSTLGRSR